MSRRLRVALARIGGQPDDESVVIDLDRPDRPGIEATGGGSVVVRARGDSTTGDLPVTAAIGSVRQSAGGSIIVEVVVDGWRFELDVEDADRADLRRRATREPDAAAASGPTEIRAIIPGRVAAIRVGEGDVVASGQGLLVVEAMKMQNELRAPRDGTVERIAVREGQTIDNGDVLVVLG